MGEFALNRLHDIIQMREVAVMEAAPPREFSNALDRIQLRAVGGQVIEREVIGVRLPPLPVKARVMVFRVVGNDHDASSTSGAGRPQVLEKVPAPHGIELLRLAPEEELAIAQADGAPIPDAAPRGIMEEHRVLGFRRHPHPATRTVLLKMHFVHGPKINRGVKA